MLYDSHFVFIIVSISLLCSVRELLTLSVYTVHTGFCVGNALRMVLSASGPWCRCQGILSPASSATDLSLGRGGAGFTGLHLTSKASLKRPVTVGSWHICTSLSVCRGGSEQISA